MSRKFMVLTAIMLVMVMLATSCSVFKKSGMEDDPEDVQTTTGQVAEDIRDTIIYYQDDAGYLVPVMRKIPWVEGIAKATLSVMMNTAEQQEDIMMMGLRALLPAETEILGLSIHDGLAKLDFNNAVLDSKDAVVENNMIQGVVLTLAGFSTIDRVQFLFDGRVVDTMKFGTKVKDPIRPQDINIEMAENASTTGAKVMVFFQSTSPSQYDYLIPVTRVIASMHATLETAIEEMLKGPKETDNMSIDIPQGTKLIGVQMNEGVTYINFSKEFSALSKSKMSEAMVFKAIRMTAMQFPEIDAIRILVEGKEYQQAPSINSTPVFANVY